MNMVRTGRILVSLVLLLSVVAVFVFTWNASHVFNPAWHPHARFHASQLVAYIAAIGLLGLVWLWQPSRGGASKIWAISAVISLFWAAEFFAYFTPGTSPSPDLANPNTFRLLGFEVYGNLFFAAVMIGLSLLGCSLYTYGQRLQNLKSTAPLVGEQLRLGQHD